MQANLSWLTDPTVFRVNRLDAHSDHVCYRSAEEAKAEDSSLRQSLNGSWRFVWSPCPDLRPADFWQKDFDISGFGTIQVPGHMETQGFGQNQYTNILYPWDGRAQLLPPEIDWDNNHVGSYVKEFDLEEGLRGQRVCVSFQGVEQAFYLWCNGNFVGYSEDSFTPSEFDLTPYIKDTGNRLCVEVYRYSNATWIEDQDFFRFSGIFRPVYLYAKPALHLEDLWLRAGLEEDNTTGTLTVRLKLDGADGAAVNCLITHPMTGTLLDEPLALREEDGYLVSQSFRFADITRWDHENPVLYRVELTLTDAEGKLSEIVPYDIGFRRFELKDGIMLLNGERIIFNGVNRHEWNPALGRAITEADMTAAMETFHRNNINAVRTCHYPNQTPWYHLCDKNGIYMIDEANMESHGSWGQHGAVNPTHHVPGNRADWKECMIDRARSMFERDKNHTAILIWSCGNESYAGTCIEAMSDYFHAQDPSRLVHYEGVTLCREFDHITDMESRMYAEPWVIREYLENNPKKPFILCEYMHCMGNSEGGMESYIRLAEEYPMYQGGFIWDYMDQALWKRDALGRKVLGYGGDFNDRTTDYSFSANGIVFADGEEKPAMQDVRYWYSSAEKRAAHDRRNAAARTAAEKELVSARAGREHRQALPLTVVKGDGSLGVHNEDVSILFSYTRGGPVSLRRGTQEWLWRAPRLSLWRAPTENDIGNGFPCRSSVWKAADSWQNVSFELLKEDPAEVIVRYHVTTPAVPALQAEITYTVYAHGDIKVEVHGSGLQDLPQLPVFGLRFETPVPVERIEWLGLSGETYPDRFKGGVFARHSEEPHIPNYLVPQECGGHMNTCQTAFHLDGGSRLVLEMDEKPFFFSALPYDPHQLETAQHKEELPESKRTVVTVCGAMRGVGGINTWGADVEEAYQIKDVDELSFSFLMRTEEVL